MRAIFKLFVFFLLSLSLIACNRANIRVPGASLSFPDTNTGFKSTTVIPGNLNIATPVDIRPDYYDKPIAGTTWTGCSTDGLWTTSASELIEERLKQELIDAKLFDKNDSLANSNLFVLKTQIKAFCSQAVGFMFVRIAGITSINFTIQKNGKGIFDKLIERVVTDDSPEYSGLQIGFLEQGMRTAMAGSLRLVMKDLLKEINLNHSKFTNP